MVATVEKATFVYGGGFSRSEKFLAEKGLTCCPPIAHSDLEDGTSANSSSSSTHTSASTSSSNGGEVVVLPPRAKSEWGAVVTDLDLRDLRILQMVEANSVCTIFEYYKLGLLMGVPHDVLTRNATKVNRMEMLVAARQMNSQLDVPDFFCNYLNWCVSVDMRQAYENKRFMQPLDLPLDMDNWQPSSSTERRQTIFENALFSFASFLCSVDHLNHADAVKPNDEERKMHTSSELMQLENEDELVNSRYAILVYEFLFQFGIQIDYLKKMGEEMFPHSEPSVWTCACYCTSS